MLSQWARENEHGGLFFNLKTLALTSLLVDISNQYNHNLRNVSFN